MNILYLITGLGLGGAEKVVVDLADQMSSKGHLVKIAYLKGPLIVCPKNESIELISLDLDTLKNLKNAFYKYGNLLKSFRPDVIHAHMIHANIFARITRIFHSVPKLICTAHNSNEGGRFRMLAYKFTNFLSDMNTNVSDEACDSLIAKGAFSKSGLVTVYNGIDLERFNKFDNKKNKKNEIKCISVGRFNEQKDYPNLFHAIMLLKNKSKNINIKFYIVGDGELRENLENLIQELGIKDLVILLGKRSDIPDLLNDANFFILSSKHEGLPTVVIEAMACQTYVIATDCGGSAEIMGDTGLLVQPQNSLALAEALEKALQLTAENVTENNKKARQLIEEKFSLKASVDKWLQIYEA